ncbi:MAG TPA: lytic transglycosylase domain-containing protein [Roseiarcus sp.]|nr:lytic transglycosylase domain-containing protein [Roseiarcus sp.]
MPDRHAPITILPRSLSQIPSLFPAMLAPIAGRPLNSYRRCHRFSARIGLVVLAIIGCRTAAAEPATTRPMALRSAYAPFAAFVAEASQRFGIPAAWIRAVMRAESVGDIGAVSPKGAMGLMQIMPETWADLRQRYRLGANPFDAHDNIIAGAAYLHELHDRYGAPGFLAAYNAGPARWEDHLATGRPLPAETRAYLIRLAPIVGGSSADDTVLLAAVMKSWTEASLFPAHPATPVNNTSSAAPAQSLQPSLNRPTQDWTGLAPQSDGLFVALSNRERSP